MGHSTRGVLYIVWGDRVEPMLQRSIASVRQLHPALPIEVIRVKPADASRPLMEKTRMGRLTPFDSTLYLDADTVVLGNLDDAFDRSEEFGLACCICECPWTRRYGAAEGDGIEYNTGVLFFSEKAAGVMTAWERLADSTPSTSRWTTPDGKPRGLDYDDQASFARAARSTGANPFVLPLNYNLRPAFHRAFFTPVKIWHDYTSPPLGLQAWSTDTETGRRRVTYLSL